MPEENDNDTQNELTHEYQDAVIDESDLVDENEDEWAVVPFDEKLDND